MYHSNIRGYAKCTWDIHYIYNIENRNLEIRKTRDDFFVQVRNLLLPLSLKVFRGERHNLSILAFSYATATKVSASKRKQAVFPEAGLISTPWLFKNLPKSSARFWCVTSFSLATLRFPSRAIVTSLSDTSALRARKHMLMLHLSNPRAEPKGSQPN